ncbi:MAG TPA: DDE-type integrase/transposase/recombinase, partial [Puia sp.]|nr:DDE-type integrase/transposase/recombinase [Puia sp.]
MVSNKSEDDALILSLDNADDSWVLDSGASFHATPHRNYFLDYVQGDFGLVYLGDNEPCQIVGKGRIKIKLQNGNHWLLQEVRHVPRLSRNLISAGQLTEQGCTVTFTDKNWKVSKGALVVAKGVKVGTLYLCTGHTVPSTLDVIEEKQTSSGTVAAGLQEETGKVAVGSETTLWHNRLGHMSEKGMKVLHSKKVLPGLKCINMDFCESCVYGKQKRVSFLKDGKQKKNKKLELVHTDVWGPAQVSSLDGSQYYVTFIDEATRKVSIYFLRQKSDVFQTFKKWRSLVEKETGKRLKCLRSDNGGEYCSKEFEDYCSFNGIRRQKTVPGTPQENGVAE